MNPSDLRSKLDAIKKKDKSSQVLHKKETIPLSEKALLENGWKKLEDMVYEKISWSENPLSDSISDFLMAEGSETSKLVFYDTETTGLSSGAGNIVFLTGFGFVEGDRFKTVQIMLSDFPGEPAFLAAMDQYIRPDRIYVSYNGRSFDANILKSRHAMNGMRVDFGFQLDLLYPSRRLWKNVIGSCSLGDIEKNILMKRRGLDVPGAMVPDLYFEFIKSGNYSSIEAVVSHHLEDIKSLAQLLSIFEKISKDPVKLTKVDRVGLSRQLIERHPNSAVAVLMAGFDEGSYKAAKELGLYYKRNKDYKAAFEVWKRMYTNRQSIFAGIELAKHLEHREKEIKKALLITEEILSFERIRIKSIISELEKRRSRLKNKLKKILKFETV
jgi:uncharacterized protein